ncbi:MAG TPA: tRNA lysidine(34) synthetase TilS, partial [Gemmatimonadaceae bacterium]
MRVNLLREIEVPVRSLLDRRQRLVLAVSGGIDSAVLLDAITRLRSPAHHLVVATVDHGTGEAATDAVALTVATAAAHRIPAITERLRPGPATEAEWRRRRWLFLRQLAAREDAVIVTAHTRDDQIETVVMRLLRGAGARGLAGLYAPSSIERPLLSASRADVMYYASRRRVAWVDDPSNLSVAYLRNRVRLNLLPAIRAVRPAFDNEILDLAHRAAQLRARVEEVAASMIVFHGADEVTVNADMLAALDNEGRRLLWPALAARVGAALDRRGIVRLAEFVSSPIGSRVPVSGGFEATRRRNEIVLRKRRNPASMSPRPIRGGASFGAFRFEAVPLATI